MIPCTNVRASTKILYYSCPHNYTGKRPRTFFYQIAAHDSADHQRKSWVMTYRQQMNYLLLTYATKHITNKAKVEIRNCKQHSGVTAIERAEILLVQKPHFWLAKDRSVMEELLTGRSRWAIFYLIRTYWQSHNDTTLQIPARHAKFRDKLLQWSHSTSSPTG